MAGNVSETSTPSELSNPTVTSSVTSNSSVCCPIQPTSICTVLGTKPTLSTPRTTDAKLFISLHSSIGTSPENSMGAQSTQGPIPKGEPDIKKRLEPAEVVIFNNALFDNNKEFQLGSNDDIGLLESTFSALKCKVTIFSDATLSDIRSNMQKLEVKSFEDRSAVVLVVLSHCHQYETIAAKDGYYNLDTEIIFPLLRNETLINKPKMLFVQAGRGSRELLRYRTDTNSNKLYAAPSDILKCYCTYEDSKSCQNTSGTSFIRELCNTLSSRPNVDIESNVKSVSKCVMASTRKSQVPLMTSTMTRKYTFGDYI
ncbi:caspase-7-like isoform X2 [Drosophila hydei]|uniref:Caspase-7-like isoform X2 n=1 Tax=Drosophila hydei TaxID=7224 RepID=A0A6J1L511_DROHY|nr:caspase-7-like isoform X2 [Drosophila hydei]